MYCSAQLYLIPSITNVHGYHWLNTECFCQKYTYFSFSSSNLYLSLSLSTETIMIIHLPSQWMLSFLKTLTFTAFILTYLVCFLCFCLHRFGHFQRCNKTKKYIFWNGNCASYKFSPKIFLSHYLFHELTKYKSITKRPRLVFIYCILQRRNQQDYNFLLMGNPTWSCIS